MRRIIVYLSAAALSLTAVAGASCGGGDAMELIFHQGVSGCAAMPEQSATIQCDEGAITFEGSVLTPNPCHYLKARLDVADQSSVDIVITASPQSGEGGYCIECVGEISFNGIVELSGACSKSVSIVYDGIVMGEYEPK